MCVLPQQPRTLTLHTHTGELVDWQNDLNSAEGTERQKDAMKKVRLVSVMTRKRTWGGLCPGCLGTV